MKRPITLRYIIALSLIIGLCATQCRKDRPEDEPEPELPPITTEGKNTFGCKVDGEIWIPRTHWASGFSGVHTLTSSYNSNTGSFLINAKKKHDGINQSMALSANLKNYGNQILLPSESAGGVYSDISKSCSFETDTVHTGEINILKHDTANGIVAGTFSFTAILHDGKDECKEIVEVTEGRFDVNYKN